MPDLRYEIKKALQRAERTNRPKDIELLVELSKERAKLYSKALNAKKEKDIAQSLVNRQERMLKSKQSRLDSLQSQIEELKQENKKLAKQLNHFKNYPSFKE